MQAIYFPTLAEAGNGDAPPPAAVPGVSAPPGTPGTPAAPAAPGIPGAPGGGAATQQPGGPAAPGAPAAQQQNQGSGMGFMLIMLLVLGGFFFMTTWSQRKEKKKRKSMLTALKKGDKIQTIGGVMGSVVEVRDSDVVVDSAGTRLRFARSAINSVIESDSKSE